MVEADKRRRVPLGRARTGLADQFEVQWTSRLNLKALLPERASYHLPGPVVRQVEFTGLEIPLLALPDERGLVVLGNRRAWAVKVMRHYDEVPVFVAESPREVGRWCEADRELTAKWGGAGPYGKPWLWSERAALLDHCSAVLHPQGGPGGRGSMARVLGSYFGVHELQVRHALYLLRFVQAGGGEGERAGALLRMVDAGEMQPQSAYRKLRSGDPVTLTWARADPLVSTRQQVISLRNAAGVLSGVLMGLRQMGDISPDLPAAVRAEVAPTINDARRLLTRIARQLQEPRAPESDTHTRETEHG